MFSARISNFEYIFYTEEDMLDYLKDLWNYATWFPVEVTSFKCGGDFLDEFDGR